MNTLWLHLHKRILSRYFTGLLVVYGFGIAAMLRANRFYLDDLGRALYGYADWLPSGRPLAELLSWVLHLSPMTMNASPLTQLAAIAFLALASLLTLDVIGLRINWWTTLATVPVGLSPYGLENLSYKFDAPSMALAVLCAVLAALLARQQSRKAFLGATALVFACASLYQPALGVFLALLLYLMLVALVSRRPLSRLLARSTRLSLPFLLGTGLYTLQAPLWFKPSEYTDYIAEHVAMPSLAELPGLILHNSLVYFNTLLRDWTGNSLGTLLTIIAVLFALALLWRCLRNAQLAVARKGRAALWPWAGRLLALPLLLACFWLSPAGLQLVLKAPVWSPRTFYAFGIMLALMLLHLGFCARSKGARRSAVCVLQGVLVWQLLIFAQVYGNLQDNQNNWEHSRMTLLASDLNAYITETGSCRIAFVGSLGAAPLNQQVGAYYPLFNRLVAIPLTSSWRWGYEALKTFGVTVQAEPLTHELAAAQRTLFLEKPGYRVEKGADGIGIVTFLPPPVPRGKYPEKQKHP